VRPGTVLGIRPEHLQIGEQGWDTVVDSVELLGAERLIHARLGEESLTIRVSAQRAIPDLGQALRVQPQPEFILTFDAATGLRRT